MKTHDVKKFIRPPILKPGVAFATFAVILAGALLAIWLLIPRGEKINTSGYQVVYMSTGQVYFGQLKNTHGEYLTLRAPYTAQDVAPNSETEAATAESATTLLKVSKQQYGPEDVISLKSDQVLFWQNLRDDSKVTQAIKNAS